MNKLVSLYRASYTGLNPASWWLSLVMLINRCGTMVVPFMALYLTQSLQYSIARAGLVVALFGAGAICGGFIGGRLADRFGFYLVQLITLVGGGLMFFLLGQMRSYTGICAVTFLLSVVNESFRPANSMAIAHYSAAENRTRSYSLNRLAINLGWALGGTLGGFIAAHNYSLLFYIDGATNIFAAVLLLLFLKAAGTRRPVPKAGEAVLSRWLAYKDKAYVVFSFLVVIYAYAFFQMFSTLPVFFREVWKLSERRIGLTMAVNGLMIALIEMVLIFRLEGRRRPLQFIVPGTVLIAASFAALNVLPAGFGSAMISTVLVTLGEMLSMPFMNTYWISRTNEGTRGQYAGLYTVSWATAQVLGPYLGANTVQWLGFTRHWWLITGITLVAAAGFYCLEKVSVKSALPAAK